MSPYLIGIAGPSGAGKSIFCKLMQANFQGVSRLKLDDFFRDIEDVPKYKEWINWDQPSSIKWDLLIKAATDLKAGSHAMVPNYSRAEDRMVGEKCVFSSPIILVDGFLTLHRPELRELLDLSIFFTICEDSQLKRRKLRQPWVEEGYLQEVMLPNARKYVMPSAKHADFIVNAELMPQGVADRCLGLIKTCLQDRLKKLEKRKIFDTVPIIAKV